MQRSPLYTLLFATAVCIACAVVVSTAAVSLKERQEANATLERQKNVLQAAGLMAAGEKLGAEEVAKRFATIEAVAVDLASGEVAEGVDPATFDQQKATADPERSRPAPPNAAQVQRLPNTAVVYLLRDDEGALELVILPVEGKGLWSTLYGFVALERDLTTIRGITFYQHGETPGLGGEVDNPRWKEKWEGREAFDETGEPAITVVKGRAGTPEEDPYEVDGLSGATLTGRGVTYLVQFWLGDHGFGPFLGKLAEREKEQS